jgi:hypothetical protein
MSTGGTPSNPDARDSVPGPSDGGPEETNGVVRVSTVPFGRVGSSSATVSASP